MKNQFDEPAKGMAQSVTRRRVLKKFLLSLKTEHKLTHPRCLALGVALAGMVALGLPRPRLPDDDAPFERRWVALIVMSLGVILMALDITIFGVVAPTLGAGLGATATQIQWAFDAFTVAMGGFVVLSGGLGERYGRKGFLQIGIAVFAAGEVVPTFAPSQGILIAGRAISGLGAAVSSCNPLTSVDTGSSRCNWKSRSLSASLVSAAIASTPTLFTF